MIELSNKLTHADCDLGTKHTHEGDYLAVLLPGYTPNSRAENFRPSRIPKDRLQSIVQSWTLQDVRLDAFFKNIALQDAEDQGTKSADEAFAAKLLFTPISASLSSSKIVINLASRIYRNNTVYLTPTLTFHAMIPDDSEIFRVVKRGSVRKLKKLVSSGAASLGDCDSMGRSLVNVRLKNVKPLLSKSY